MRINSRGIRNSRHERYKLFKNKKYENEREGN